VIQTNDRNEVIKNLDRIEIYIGDAPWDLVSKMPRLQWLQTWSAGVDMALAYPEVPELPVRITNTSGMHIDQLAEQLFGMIFAWTRYFLPVFAAKRERRWLKVFDDKLDVVSGKSMLILGYGKIGRKIAQAAKVFGMEVTGVRRRPERTAEEDGVPTASMDALMSLLPRADYVVNILPNTAETKGLMDSRAFAAMKKGAVYANIGRGPTTDEGAMIEALQSGRLGAALLDVFRSEPLPPDSPLWDMENVIITPHYAGMRKDYSDLALEIALENLDHYNRGEPLRNEADKKAGY